MKKFFLFLSFTVCLGCATAKNTVSTHTNSNEIPENPQALSQNYSQTSHHNNSSETLGSFTPYKVPQGTPQLFSVSEKKFPCKKVIYGITTTQTFKKARLLPHTTVLQYPSGEQVEIHLVYNGRDEECYQSFFPRDGAIVYIREYLY